MTLAGVAEIVLPRLGAATLQSVFLVTIVWALCRYMPRLGAAARCWLWWLVPVQLLVALIWPMPLGLPLLPSQQMIARIDNVAMRDAVAATAGAGHSGWPSILLLFWLAGVAAMAVSMLRSYQAARRCLAQSRPVGPSLVLDEYRRIGAALGLRTLPELRVSGAIDSPQLVGPLRPAILVPETQMAVARDELDMMLRHELMHWIRRDLWWGWLPALAQHAFFFNPMAHLAAREYALAREAACDAAVLSSHRHAPQDYARLLLRLGVAARPCAGMASASPTFQVLKRRLAMLQHAAAPSHAGMLGLSIAVAALGVVPYRVVARATVAPMSAVQVAAAAQSLTAPTPTAEGTRHPDDTEAPDARSRADGTALAGERGVGAGPRAPRGTEREEQAHRAARWQTELQAAQTRFDAEQRDAHARFRAEQQAAQASFQEELQAARINFDDEVRAARAEQQAQLEAQRADYEARRAQLQSDEEERATPTDLSGPAPSAADVFTDISGA